VKSAFAVIAVVFSSVFVAAVASTAEGPASNSDESKIQQGFQLSPVLLDLTRKNRASVGLGSYIVNAVAGCNDCHTCRSYASDPYHGGTGAPNATNYLAGGVVFNTPDGTFTSPNLTPTLDTGLPDGGHTFEQFLSMMRTGHDADPPFDILQVMPWPIYGKMTDRDLRAVYDFLGAIPHAEPGRLFPGGPACPAPGL
jgi:hypothetical protein